ncbi:MAG: TIR domain-containing protein [Fimbriimonas sp.]|nr:TIR domain-containing protein [Fimbriimonas sp.]
MARIFLSYGHDDSVEIARILKAWLVERGHRVWLDEADLARRLSVDWEREIESEILDSDVFLALLSPRSVQPDSFCRNELAHAHDARKRIVPVMVRRCELPLRINTLQYLDLDGWERRDGLLHYLMDALVEAVECGVPEDPHQSDLRRQFPAIDFSEDFARHRCFAGRSEVFSRIDAWAHSPSASPVLFILGPPAIGKSALIANWVSKRLGVGAVHFCRHDRTSTRRLEDFARSVAAQILQLGLDGYAESLRSIKVDRLDPNSDEFFVRTVAAPLRDLPAGRSWTLAVDALDEAEPALANMLGRVWRDLPSNLRLLVTSRPGWQIEEKFPKPLVLDAASADNRRDLAAHVQAELSLGRLGERLRSSGADPNKIAEAIGARAEGTFLVAVEILRALTDGDLALDRLDEWPQGLGGLHRQYLERQFPHRDSFDVARMPLALHLSALEPVTDADVAEVCGQTVRTVQAAMDCLGSLMPESADGRRSAWHKSYFDWMSDLRAGDDFAVDLNDSHVRWAAWCESHLGKEYALRFAVAHRLISNDEIGARSLLCDWSYLRRRVRSGLIWQTIEETLQINELPDGRLDPVKAVEKVIRTKASELADDPGSFDSILASDLPIAALEGLSASIQFDHAVAVRVNRSRPTVERMRLIHPPFDHIGWVDYSPYGKLIATAILYAVNLWDSATGRHSRRLNAGEHILDCDWSPNGERIIAGTMGHKVHVWDVQSGNTIITLRGHTDWVHAVAYSPDGRTIASGSGDSTVRLWDAQTSEPLHSFGTRGRVVEISFSPDGRRVAALSHIALQLWDVETGELYGSLEAGEFDGGARLGYQMTYLADGRILFVADVFGHEQTIRIWDTENRPAFTTVLAGFEKINCLSLSRDQRRIAVSSTGGVVDIWVVSSWEKLGSYVAGCDAKRGISFAPDGHSFATQSYSDEVRVWDLQRKGSEVSMDHFGGIESLDISPDGRWLCGGTQADVVGIWDAQTGAPTKSMQHSTGHVWKVQFSPDGRQVSSGHWDGTYRIWDVESGAQTMEFASPTEAIYQAAFHRDGKILASCSEERLVRLWELETRKEIGVLDGHTAEVESLCFFPDGRRIASGSLDNTIRVWDLETKETLLLIDGFDGAIDKLAVSPDGKQALAGWWHETFFLFDPNTGVILRTFDGHEARVTSLAFSPDGRTIASAAYDRTIRLWDVESGKEAYRIHTDDANVHAVFDPSSPARLLAAVGRRIWVIQILPPGQLDMDIFALPLQAV